MGYLPTSSDFETAGMSQDDGRGEVFRYRQTGKKEGQEGKESYSEIGFYHRPTSWKSSGADQGNYAAATAEGYPKIDQIRIHSTGDVHESAVNHHRVQAKRFELFIDCDPPKTADYKADPPFGDKNGDDSFLYAGDAHIRAKNRVVIKAGESIELQAGRSSIIINDEGITIASRKTQSNIYNSWDTVLTLKASKGITMFGQHVGIRGGINFTLEEGYGGSISSRLGVMRLSGFDIRAETLNTFNYLARGIGNGIDFLLNAGTMIAGSAGANTSLGKLGSLASTSPAVNFFASKGSTGMAGGSDFQGLILGLLDILLLALMVVEIALEMAIPKVHKRDKHGRDGLYTVLALAEYGLILECFRELCSPSLPYAFFESSLHLTSKASVLLDGLDILTTAKTIGKGNSPLAGLSSKTAKEAYKKGFTKFKDNLITKLSENAWKIVGGGIVGLFVAGGLITGMVLSNKQDKELEEELRSL
ncbi:MAG: hypothetical protein LBC51_12105 [Treponema sp.]|nr:hypothetical protein [Treponema sp.]